MTIFLGDLDGLPKRMFQGCRRRAPSKHRIPLGAEVRPADFTPQPAAWELRNKSAERPTPAITHTRSSFFAVVPPCAIMIGCPRNSKISCRTSSNTGPESTKTIEVIRRTKPCVPQRSQRYPRRPALRGPRFSATPGSTDVEDSTRTALRK